MAAAAKQYDLLIYGASGFTGRLVSLYLTRNAPEGLKWGIAGRNLEKLQKIADECKRVKPSVNVNVVVGHAEVAALTKAIITTAGPYMLYGEPLLAACVEHGTDYADLTGETLWVHKMIQKYGEQAKTKGVMIVNMSGFDSIPGDLGTFFLASEARKQGARLSEVTAYITARGSISGGTLASGLNMAKQPDKGLTNDPFIMNPLKSDNPASGIKPESIVTPAPDFRMPFWVPALGQYAWFWIMGTINTRVVRRSATIFATQGDKLAGHKNSLPSLPGNDRSMAISKGPFTYTEWSLAKGWFEAMMGTMALGLVGLIMALPGGPALLNMIVPQPGQGPSDARIASNWFQYILIGKTEEAPGVAQRTVVARMHGRDGGYGDTSLMLAETGMALALQRAELPGTALGGGFLTPSTALGHVLVRRLNAANLRIEMIPSVEQAKAAAGKAGPPPPLGTPSTF